MVRPVCLSGDDVLQSVAVHVHQRDRVRLGEEDAVRTLFSFVADDDVLLERDRIAIFRLLEPREAIRVSRQTRDDVVVAVTIHVVSEHVGSTRPGELELVTRPERIAFDRLRLLVPAPFPDHVLPTVTIDVADTEAVSERVLADLFRDRMPDPRLIGLRHVERRIAERPGVIADQLRLSVTDQVHKLRRLIPDAIEHVARLPVRGLSHVLAGVHVQLRRRTGQPDRDQIVPAVPRKVVDPSKKIARVPVAVLRLGVIDFVRLRELRPLKPERPVDDIRLAIFVDVAEVGPFGKVDLGELLPLEPMDAEVLGHNVSQRHHTANDQTTERGNRTETHDGVSRSSNVGKSLQNSGGSMPNHRRDNKR